MSFVLRIEQTQDTFFTLKQNECIPLELKLNVTSKGRIWKSVGDHLYNFVTDNKNTSDVLTVTKEQYNFLLFLQTMSGWQECKGI